MTLDPGTLFGLAALFSLERRVIQDWVSDHRDRQSERQAQEQKAKIKRYCGPEIIAETLRQFYDNSENPAQLTPYSVVIEGKQLDTSMLLDKLDSTLDWLKCDCTGTHPLAKCPEIVELIANLDETDRKLIGKFATRVASSLAIDGVEIFNDPMFRLTAYEFGSGFQFTECNYHDYRYSCGLLEDELKIAIAEAEGDVGRIVAPDAFELRSRLLPDLASILAVDSRVCCGGVSTLTAFLREDDYVIPLQRRSAAVGDNQNQLATIAKGIHGPLTGDPSDIMLAKTIWREFYEELFSGEKDVRRFRQMISGDWWLNEPNAAPVRYLRENPEQSEQFGLGFGFNMVSGNYEFPNLFIIKNFDFLKRFKVNGCWEAEKVSYVSSKDILEIREILTNKEVYGLVNECVPTFVRGLKLLKEIDPTRVELPEMVEV